jgi:lactoylglutathione lyase
MIIGIAHNAIRVTDMEKAIEFYCDIVGFTKAFEIADANGKPWIVYIKICKNAFLELFYEGAQHNDPVYSSGRVGYHHWCVSVGDLERIIKISYDKGWIKQPEAGVGGDGNRSIWIHDPDGNALEFVSFSPESPHMKCNEKEYDYLTPGYTGIGHMAFVVSDMEKALDFYCDKLGFKHFFSLNDKNGNPWLNYLRVKDGSYIELFYGGKERVEPKQNAAGFMHMCLECDDVYSTVEFLQAKGVNIDTPPKQGSDKNTQAWIRDPDGNRIELMAIDPSSPQANA